MSLSASRSAKDCLRNSSSRARYDSAAIPAQLGSELCDAASRSSRRCDAEVSFGVDQRLGGMYAGTAMAGMPGIEVRALMGS